MPWLGEIPAHWKAVRAKYLYKEIDDRSVTGTEEQLSVSHLTGVTPRRQKDVTMFKAESYIGHKLCNPGDLVINTMWAWMAALGVAREDGIVSPSYGVYRQRFPDALKPDFVDYLLRTEGYRSEYFCRSTGIRPSRLRLYPDRFLEIPVLRPPPNEQSAIASFLDAANQRIQRLIRAKRSLIELLDEQKQILIHRAVTRGLDPNVPMKASGVEWLGKVPEAWQLSKLKFLASFSNGFAFKPEDWEDAGVPIIRIQNLNGQEDFNYTTRGDISEHLMIEPGDLLFAWSGNRGTSFGSFLWDRPYSGYLNQHIFKLHSYSVDKVFFYYLLRAVTSYVEEKAHGIIGLVHVTRPELGSIRVPVPPKPIQRAIGQQLEEAMEELAKVASKAQSEIQLLQEYKTRLISDVVTGKLDVRNVDLPLLPEADEALSEKTESEDETH